MFIELRVKINSINILKKHPSKTSCAETKEDVDTTRFYKHTALTGKPRRWVPRIFYKHTALTGLKRAQPDRLCNKTLPETLHTP